MRTLLLAAVLAPLAVPPLAAEEPAVPGRFEVTATSEGFIRLDTRTGATSHCTRPDGIWRCQPVIEEEGALAVRIDAVADEIARLSATVASLDDQLDALAERLDETPSIGAEASEVAEGRGFVATALDRLLAFVRLLKHGGTEAA